MLLQLLRGALVAEAPPLLRQHAPPAFQTLIEDLQVGRGDAFLALLARQAVVNFVHNDLHWAVKKFLANAKVRLRPPHPPCAQQHCLEKVSCTGERD